MSASPQTLKNEADTIQQAVLKRAQALGLASYKWATVEVQLQDGAKIKTTNIYSVRHGYPITPQEALDVGQVITQGQAKNGGEFSCDDLIEAARSKKSLAHPYYFGPGREEKFAELGRRDRARIHLTGILCAPIILDSENRRITRKLSVAGLPTTIPISVASRASSTGAYEKGHTSKQQMLDTEEGREMLVQRALDDIVRTVDRYRNISELSAIFAAVDEATRKYGN